MKDLIPLYPEFGALLDHIERKDWRVSVIRVIFHCLRFLVWAAAVGVFMFMVVLSSVILFLLVPGFPLDFVILMATLAAALVVSFSLVTYGYTLRYEQVATSLGKQRLREARRRISKASPIRSFWEMLRSESYEAQFSEIVAIYGIAPLIILA